MPTPRKLLQQARRAVLAAFVLGGFACLLQLTLPLYALHVLESAVPAASIETLGLLALIAAGTVALWTCIAAARDRILLRAGLWLDHTLGQRLLEDGERSGSPPAEIEKDADALAAFATALAERSLVPALDAPWLALSVVVLGLLHPMMGAVAAACAALVILVSMAQARPLGRIARQVAEARKGTATWWLAATLAPSLPSGAAAEWSSSSTARTLPAPTRSASAARCCRMRRLCCGRAAQVVFVALGAWLVIGHELTLAALVACVLINAACWRRWTVSCARCRRARGRCGTPTPGEPFRTRGAPRLRSRRSCPPRRTSTSGARWRSGSSPSCSSSRVASGAAFTRLCDLAPLPVGRCSRPD